MSEPVSKRQPLIDLDEFERLMGRPDVAPANDGAAIVELMRLVGGGDEITNEIESAHRTVVFQGPENDTRGEGKIASDPGETPERVIGGDFAEIEAALLRAATQAGALADVNATREPESHGMPALRALRDEADAADDYAGGHFSAIEDEFQAALAGPALTLSARRDDIYFEEAVPDSDRFMLVDDAAVSGAAALADEEKRSRRPLYLMAAVVLAGVVGVVASSGLLRREAPLEASLALAKPAAIEPAPVETAAANAAPEATTQARLADATPTAAQTTASADAQVAPTDAPAPAHDASPRVISLNEPTAAPATPEPQRLASATASILAPPPMAPQTLAPALSEPVAAAALAEPKKVKTASVRPDGSIVKNAAVNAAPAKETAAKPAVAKAAPGKTLLAKDAAKAPVKTAAETPRPGSAVKTATAKPAHAGKAVVAEKDAHAKALVQTAAAKPVILQENQATPAPAPAQPAPQPQKTASAGPLAFVDTAMDSISGATNKLLDWGRNATSAHN